MPSQIVSLSLSKVQLDKSDICELIAVYDTCTVDNVVFRSDNTGTKKYYTHMTESELKYAADQSTLQVRTKFGSGYQMHQIDTVTECPYHAAAK